MGITLYRLYAIIVTLSDDKEEIVEYVTAYHPVAASVLKRKMMAKLRSTYPEYAVSGGDKYFNIKKEQLLESYEGWNRYSILPKEVPNVSGTEA